MKMIKTKCRVTEDGSLMLAPGVLESMNAEIGDIVYLSYLSDEDVEQNNSYSKIVLSKERLEEEPEDKKITLPHSLLYDADIPLDSDLNIQCSDGIIMISKSDDPINCVPLELMHLFDDLKISHDTVRTVSKEGEYFV